MTDKIRDQQGHISVIIGNFSCKQNYLGAYNMLLLVEIIKSIGLY